MSRSIKKGPFVQPVLLKRIQEMNAAGEKKIVKTWSRASVMFRCMSRRTWLATNSASLPRPEPLRAMPVLKQLVNKAERSIDNGSRSKGLSEIRPYFSP